MNNNNTWALDYNNLVILSLNYLIQQNFMQYETEVTISRVKMTNILMVYTHIHAQLLVNTVSFSKLLEVNYDEQLCWVDLAASTYL